MSIHTLLYKGPIVCIRLLGEGSYKIPPIKFMILTNGVGHSSIYYCVMANELLAGLHPVKDKNRVYCLYSYLSFIY